MAFASYNRTKRSQLKLGNALRKIYDKFTISNSNTAGGAIKKLLLNLGLGHFGTKLRIADLGVFIVAIAYVNPPYMFKYLQAEDYPSKHRFLQKVADGLLYDIYEISNSGHLGDPPLGL